MSAASPSRPSRACRSSWPRLFDGERSVNLVWVGRRRIAGIDPGVFLTAEGRIAKVKGQPTIFNPTYQIVPTK